MMNLFAPLARSGGSLAALAAALTFALPASAQDSEFEPGVIDVPPARVDSLQPRTVEFKRPPQVTVPRYDPPADVAPRPEPSRMARLEAPVAERTAAPRFERPAPIAAQRPAALAAEDPPARPRARGFGGDVINRARAAQQMEYRGEQRAERIDRRSEQRAERVDRRSEQRAERVEQRGDIRAGQLDWRGRERAADRVDRRFEQRADRVEDRGDRRAYRAIGRPGDGRGERRGEGRDGWRGNRDGSFGDRVGSVIGDARRADRDWRDGRRDDWRDGHRDDWRDDRRGDWRRDRWRGERRGWRQDDWRWGWNGRPGWDNRDFRRWDRRWRDNRRFDWFDFRRGNRFLFSPGPYFAPFRSHRYSRLNQGFFLDSLFFQPRFFINDPWAYHLPPVYGPYQWIRYYDDVLLVDIYTGEVVDVIHDFFW